MANYTPSNLVAAQAVLLGAFQSSELRFRQPVVFKEFLRNGNFMFPDASAVRTREDRTTTTYYKKRAARSLATGRSHNHTGTKGDTGTMTPSWTTYNDEFVISLKQGDNNVYGLQEMLNHEIQQVISNFAEGAETVASEYLFNNRSQVNAVAVEGTFDAVTNAYEITETTHGTRAMQISKSVMEILKYGSNFTVFCDTISYNKFNYQANQGNANNANLSFQFMGVNFVHDISLTAQAAVLGYTKGFWEIVPEGTIGALTWIPKQNRQGIDTKVNTYGTILNPVDGETYAVHTYEERQDGTATGGYTQDVKTEFEISIDVTLDHAPLSTANETTIQAFALV